MAMMSFDVEGAVIGEGRFYTARNWKTTASCWLRPAMREVKSALQPGGARA